MFNFAINLVKNISSLKLDFKIKNHFKYQNHASNFYFDPL